MWIKFPYISQQQAIVKNRCGNEYFLTRFLLPKHTPHCIPSNGHWNNMPRSILSLGRRWEWLYRTINRINPYRYNWNATEIAQFQK